MKSSFLKISYLLALLLISSSIYINTFWKEFGIDFFSYIEISELLMYGLSPLIQNSIPVIVGLVIAILFLDKLFPYGVYQELKNKEIETGTKIITKFEKYVRFFVGILFFGFYPLLLIKNYFTDINQFYHQLPINISLFTILITNKLMSYGAIVEINIDSKVIFFSIFLLTSSYSTAKLNSKKINSNKDFNYVINNKKYLKLIGKGGDFYFLKSLNNAKTIIIKNDKLDRLKYYHFNGILKTKNDSLINKLVEKQTTYNNGYN